MFIATIEADLARLSDEMNTYEKVFLRLIEYKKTESKYL